MAIVFDEIIFGPVMSRRLGLSLGINVLPLNKKHCSYNCIYCECGWTNSTDNKTAGFFDQDMIIRSLETSLKDLQIRNVIPDAITFAGNGEPTLHPQFVQLIDNTLELRDKYFPQSEVVVLSNSTTAGDTDIINALLKVKSIMKLDSGTESMHRMINMPFTVSLSDITRNLKKFNGKLIIQTLLLRAEWQGKIIDNTTDNEVDEWLKHIQGIRPEHVMLYPVARPSPIHKIEKVSTETIERIAQRVKNLGIEVKIYE